MGGIITIEYLFPDEFILFSQTHDQVVYKKKPSAAWREIPFPYMNVTPTLTAGGTAPYGIDFKIKVIHQELTMDKIAIMGTIYARGCVIRYTTAEGKKEIIGSPKYPLFGPLNRIVGKTAKDYSGYELTLTGSSTYPPLPYSEL